MHIFVSRSISRIPASILGQFLNAAEPEHKHAPGIQFQQTRTSQETWQETKNLKSSYYYSLIREAHTKINSTD